MNISKKDAKLLLILLGLAILIAAYLAIYMPNINKTESIESETAALQPTLDQLNEYYSNLGAYYTGIDNFAAISDAELSHYPASVRYEDIIMFAVTLQDKIGIDVAAISFVPASYVMDFNTIEENENGETVTASKTAYSINFTVDCSLGYDQLKKMCDYIADSEYRTALDTLSVSYDNTTGALTAQFSINKYFVTSPDDEYVPTGVPSVTLGRDDIFGTVGSAGAIQVEED